jgi:molybdopterin converting factor small subunit
LILARILFFGRLADVAGTSELTHKGGMSLSALIEDLGTDHSHLSAALGDPSVRAALNLTLIAMDSDPLIGTDDELAFMPPLSGG